ERGVIGRFLPLVFDEHQVLGALIDNLHVVHHHQRGGVGTRLMAGAAGSLSARTDGGGLYVWVLQQNAAAQAFYEARGGRSSGRAQVLAPGGIATRLNGSPLKVRYVW